MTHILRFPNLALGALEVEVLDILWTHGALQPNAVHEHIGEGKDITIKTVASALKRLYEKELLSREKISHAYVYKPAVDRASLQRQLIGTITSHFDSAESPSFLSAFVDLAEEHGEDALRQLEQMIAARLQHREES